MINEGKYIVELVRSVLEERNPQVDGTKVDFERLFKLAEIHYVTGICYRAVKDVEGVPEGVLSKMRKSYDMTCAKEAIQEIEVKILLDRLETEGIKHMPLKGFILKNIYPRPDMRLSADVDILIDCEKTDEIEEIMKSLGYTPMTKGVHHDVYHKKPVMNVEMHKKLMSELVDIYDYFKEPWSKAVRKEGKHYEYMQSIEDFYIYQMGHLYKHYSKGGAGIRSVLDTYIYLKKYGDVLDRDYLEKEFEKMGILDFVLNYEQLSFNWFEKGQVEDDQSLYILSSGVFGTRHHSVLSNTIKKSSEEDSIKKLRFKYLVNRVFLPYDNMKIMYPVLNKAPVLLPVYWVVRIARFLVKGKTTIKDEFEVVGAINEDNLRKMKEIKKESGIK